jgi:hypothetical protein
MQSSNTAWELVISIRSSQTIWLLRCYTIVPLDHSRRFLSETWVLSLAVVLTSAVLLEISDLHSLEVAMDNHPTVPPERLAHCVALRDMDRRAAILASEVEL